jgi:hypothetical protein
MTKRRGSSGRGVSANDWRARGSGQFGLDDVFRSDEQDEGGIDIIPAALRVGHRLRIRPILELRTEMLFVGRGGTSCGIPIARCL